MKANDIIHNIVKDKLKRDEVVASMTVRLVRGVEIARLAATAGFDMIYIDLEHSTLTLEATAQICQAALSAGVTPMVRVPVNTPGAMMPSAPACDQPRRPARLLRPRSLRRSANAVLVARCRSWSSGLSRPLRRTPLSTMPPW